MDDIKQHLTHIKNGVKITYMEYLNKLNEINTNTRYSRTKLAFGASGAGLCHLKHYFRSIGEKRKEVPFDSMCKMRLGTLVHEDIQNALNYMFKDYKVMCELPVAYCNVRGHLDIVIEIDDKNAMLIDIKTMAAFPWSKKYGKDKEAHASVWSKYQLATYSLGLKEEYGYENVHMYLLNYNKNTSDMRFEEVQSAFFEDQAKKYWEDVEKTVSYLLELRDISHVHPKESPVMQKAPVHNWECGYCDYSDTCPAKYVKEK